MSSENLRITRRDFVKTTAAAATAAMIVPRHVLGRGFQAPSDLGQHRDGRRHRHGRGRTPAPS